MNIVNLLLPPHASVELPEHAILQSPCGAAIEPLLIELPQTADSTPFQQGHHLDQPVKKFESLQHSCEYSVPAIAKLFALQYAMQDSSVIIVESE